MKYVIFAKQNRRIEPNSYMVAGFDSRPEAERHLKALNFLVEKYRDLHWRNDVRSIDAEIAYSRFYGSGDGDRTLEGRAELDRLKEESEKIYEECCQRQEDFISDSGILLLDPNFCVDTLFEIKDLPSPEPDADLMINKILGE